MQSLGKAWRIVLLGAVVAATLPASAALARAGHGPEKTASRHDAGPRTATSTRAVTHESEHATTHRASARFDAETGHRLYSARGTNVALRDAVYYHETSKYALRKNGKARYVSRGYAYSYGGLQCVPFARAASGIELKGNAANWWEAAAGVYQRGSEPEPGSVLNFRATGSMRLGHVAVVTAVVNSREIEIDHANWWGPGASKGGVSRGVPVVDVSPNNDWTEVRVGLGQSGDFGSTYPTYGFIYDRPDDGMIEANSIRYRAAGGGEVAEAPRR
jgi:hypothetical protein